MTEEQPTRRKLESSDGDRVARTRLDSGDDDRVEQWAFRELLKRRSAESHR